MALTLSPLSFVSTRFSSSASQSDACVGLTGDLDMMHASGVDDPADESTPPRAYNKDIEARVVDLVDYEDSRFRGEDEVSGVEESSLYFD